MIETRLARLRVKLALMMISNLEGNEMPTYPRVSNTNNLSIFLKKDGIKDARYVVDEFNETKTAYEIKLREAIGGHLLNPINGTHLRLQFRSSLMPKGWPQWNASPAFLKGTTLIVMKRTLVPRVKRIPRKAKTVTPARNGADDGVSLNDILRAVGAINNAKKELGKSCKLSISKSGFVKALIDA